MTSPRCQYFGKCGGCSSQHIDYTTQLENKKEMVRNLIIGSGMEIDSHADDIKVFSDKPYGYRNRMDFIFHPGGLGFRQKGKFNRIIDIEQCPIANDRLNSILKDIRDWFKDNRDSLDIFNPSRKTGTLRYALIRTPEFTDDAGISFALNADSAKIGPHIEMIKSFAQGRTENIIISYVKSDTDASTSTDFFSITGNDTIAEKLNDKVFNYSSQGFFQNNSVMAAKMIDYARELTKRQNTKDALLLDLYGGVGAFGISLADLFDKVLIVESFQQSIDTAKINIETNNTINAEAICHDATNLKRLDIEKQAQGRPVFVLTDPPRSGMHQKTISYLLEIEPKHIIYVSCNPQQLSRELSRMKDKYRIMSVAMFDLFPHTPHVEVVVELDRITDR